MKIKSPTSKWAMALGAVAVFSFTAVRDAQAGRYIPVGPPGPTILPVGTSDNRLAPRLVIQPLPPLPAPPSGTFTGTVIVD